MDLEKRDKIVAYLADRTYPRCATENEKRIIRRQAQWFVLKNGRILYHIRDAGKTGKTVKTRDQRTEEAQLVIVGEREKHEIIKHLHYGLGGEHFGINKTIEKIGERYWWPGFTKDIKVYIGNCKACQLANLLNKPENATSIDVTLEFGYRWCIDLIGPLCETEKQNRYIVVATEYLTRYAVAKSIQNKDAVTVAEFIFEDIVCMFGIMKTLQHNQGQEFCNNLIRFLCDKLQILEEISIAYHPQTNGVITERFNQTLITQLMKVCNEKKNDWDHYINPTLFAYRVSIQESTKKTPFEMLFGVKAHLPTDIYHPVHTDVDPADNIELEIFKRMTNITEQIVKTRKESLQNLASVQEKRKKIIRYKHQGSFYKIGDFALKYNRRRETRQGNKI